MSTPAERAQRAARFILPIKLLVRQSDGSRMVQIVDASVRTPKFRRPGELRAARRINRDVRRVLRDARRA